MARFFRWWKKKERKKVKSSFFFFFFLYFVQPAVCVRVQKKKKKAMEKWFREEFLEHKAQLQLVVRDVRIRLFLRRCYWRV